MKKVLFLCADRWDGRLADKKRGMNKAIEKLLMKQADETLLRSARMPESSGNGLFDLD